MTDPTKERQRERVAAGSRPVSASPQHLRGAAPPGGCRCLCGGSHTRASVGVRPGLAVLTAGGAMDRRGGSALDNRVQKDPHFALFH